MICFSKGHDMISFNVHKYLPHGKVILWFNFSEALNVSLWFVCLELKMLACDGTILDSPIWNLKRNGIS